MIRIGLLACWMGCVLPATLMGADHFLVMGGGYSPKGNQISLEKNVQYFRRVLERLNLQARPLEIFFADGDAPGRDLQYRDPDFDDQSLRAMLARLTGSTSGLSLCYRTNELRDLGGESSLASLDRWVEGVGRSLGPDDRLVMYFTGHGGRGEKKAPGNTTMMLWNNQRLRMSDFVERLDRLPAQVPVVLVMVQCYSGGFANVIFKEGDPDKGLSDHPRCGFFSTVHTRTAAGCTPDIDEAHYEEFSTHFWAALSGRTRLGEAVERPDYDGDGRVGCDEAQAYTQLVSDTIDISIKTSGTFLRHFSKTDKPKDLKEDAAWLTVDAPYATLIAAARAPERAVLEGLSTQLKLEGESRAKAARSLGESLQKKRKALAGEKKKLGGEYNKLKKEIAVDLLRDWPELANAWHPMLPEMLKRDGEAIEKKIFDHPRFKRFQELVESVGKIDRQRLDLERRWVKCQRWLRTAENVALAHNLPHVADEAVQKRFAELLALEGRGLEQAPPHRDVPRP